MPLSPAASDVTQRLIEMLRRLLTETPLVDEEDGEHPVIDQARALLATVTPPLTTDG